MIALGVGLILLMGLIVAWNLSNPPPSPEERRRLAEEDEARRRAARARHDAHPIVRTEVTFEGEEPRRRLGADEDDDGGPRPFDPQLAGSGWLEALEPGLAARGYATRHEEPEYDHGYVYLATSREGMTFWLGVMWSDDLDGFAGWSLVVELEPSMPAQRVQPAEDGPIYRALLQDVDELLRALPGATGVTWRDRRYGGETHAAWEWPFGPRRGVTIV